MFKIQNAVSKRFVRDMISGKTRFFDSREDAKAFAESIHRDSVLSATAWNSKRGFSYQIVAA